MTSLSVLLDPALPNLIKAPRGGNLRDLFHRQFCATESLISRTVKTELQLSSQPTSGLTLGASASAGLRHFFFLAFFTISFAERLDAHLVVVVDLSDCSEELNNTIRIVGILEESPMQTTCMRWAVGIGAVRRHCLAQLPSPAVG